MENNKSRHPHLSYWLFGSSILLLIISVSLNISTTVITNESIVLVFIGILATFIVVGNYSQVIELKNNINSKIVEIEEKQAVLTEQEIRLNRIENNLLNFLFNQFEHFLSEDMGDKAFDFFFENYSKEFENKALGVMWMYYGDMYIGDDKTEDAIKYDINKLKEQKIKANSKKVSVDFIKYMEKYYLSNGKTSISILS